MNIDSIKLCLSKKAKEFQGRGDHIGFPSFQRACFLTFELARSVMSGGLKSLNDINPLFTDYPWVLPSLRRFLLTGGESYSILAETFEGAHRIVALVDVKEDDNYPVKLNIFFYSRGMKKPYSEMFCAFSHDGGMEMLRGHRITHQDG